MAEEESRDDIIDIVNNEEPVNEEPKPKAKVKSRAKPKIKITKEPVVEEPVVEEAIVAVVEKLKKVYKLKEIVKCPDCHMDMTVHTLKYIHKRRGFCKADVKPEAVPEKNTRTNSTTKTKANYRRYCK